MIKRFKFVGDELKLPKFVEDKKSPIVKYGENNLYPDYLIELLGKSGKHNALVTGKVHYIAGEGFEVSPDYGTPQDRSELRTKLGAINPEEDANEVLGKITFDLELFGGFALQYVESEDGENAYWYHVDFSKLRVSQDGESFYYHEDWAKFGGKPAKALNDEDLKIFTPYKKGEPINESIYYCYDYRPSYEYYPLPEYLASIPYIEVDYRIANFHLNNIKNGMSAGSIISFFNGIPTEDEMSEIERRFKEKHTGDGNAGGPMFHFADKNGEGAKVETILPNNFDKLWVELNDTVQQELFIGHKIPNPMLFGVRVEGTLGGRNELIDSFELFKCNYVDPKQRKIEDAFNYILDTNALTIKDIPTIKPQLSEGVLSQILDRNELREIAGYKPIEADKKSFADEADLRIFEKIGGLYKDFEVLGTREMEFSEEGNPILKEASFRLGFQLDLDEIDKQLIDLLEEEPQRSIEELSKATGESEEGVTNRLKKLVDQGALNESVTTNDIGEEFPTYEPTQEAIEEAQDVEKKIITVYKYAERPDAAPAKTGSRPFCERMMTLSSAGHRYTRDEINQISALAGRDVWTRRGGWYNIPGTSTSRPSCRHYWVQEVIAV